MTELVQVDPTTQVHPQVEQLRHQLVMAEQARADAQNDYRRIKQRYEELVQEKNLVEAMLIEKNEILGAPMTVWINSRQITSYYKGGWRRKMGVQINHEGIITGFVKDPSDD